MVKVSGKNRESGIAVLVTSLVMLLAVPMVGLCIDGTVLYVVKCRLQGAADGAALAAAKALARGSDDSSQQTSAKNAAATYVMLNFPSGYFFSNAVVCNPSSDVVIDESVAHERIITVNAHVTVPTMFMRWFNLTSTTVNAQAQTVRRDVNVVITLDRSGSLALTGSCNPLKNAATNFVNQFSEGRDYVGLVTFATASKIPADFPLATDFSSLPTTINNITCNGGTSTALGLYNAYSQLVTLNQPAALNVILLFTDGYPTDLTAAFPVTDSCVNATGTLDTTFTVGNPSDPSTWHPAGMIGLYTPNTPDATVITPNTNCHYTNTTDLAYIPNTDLYGNSINSGYQALATSGGHITLNYTNLDNASMNAADSMALRIRQGATISGGSISNVVMYSIGLGNAGGVAGDFLERVANDPRGSNYDNTYPTGLYIYASDTSTLNQAFAAVASEILRLAK